MFKRVLLAASFSIVTISAVQAADMEPYVGFDWTGVYVGAHVGYGDPSFDGLYDGGELPDREEVSFADNIDADGVLGGIQAGYNHQIDNIVLGIEADISFSDFSGDTKDAAPDSDDGIEADVDYLASLRLRIGFAADTFLVYATGGLAYADGEFEIIESPDETASVDIDEFGFAVGGGIEWAATENASFRIEGLYYGFGEDHDTSAALEDSDEGDFIEFEDVIAVRAGVNWRF